MRRFAIHVVVAAASVLLSACGGGSSVAERPLGVAPAGQRAALSIPPPLTRRDYEVNRFGAVGATSVAPASASRQTNNVSTNSRLGTISVVLNSPMTPTLIASGLSISPSYVPSNVDGGGPSLQAVRHSCLYANVENSNQLGDHLRIRCSSPYDNGVEYSLSDSNFIAKYEAPAIINQSRVVDVELLVDSAGVGHAFLYNYLTSQWDLAYSNSGISSGSYAGTFIDEGAADSINGPCPSRPEFLHWSTTIDDGSGHTHLLGLNDASVSGPAPLTSCWSTSGTVSPYYQVTFPNSDYSLWYVDQH
jgi:hypothetical protein